MPLPTCTDVSRASPTPASAASRHAPRAWPAARCLACPAPPTGSCGARGVRTTGAAAGLRRPRRARGRSPANRRSLRSPIAPDPAPAGRRAAASTRGPSVRAATRRGVRATHAWPSQHRRFALRTASRSGSGEDARAPGIAARRDPASGQRGLRGAGPHSRRSRRRSRANPSALSGMRHRRTARAALHRRAGPPRSGRRPPLPPRPRRSSAG